MKTIRSIKEIEERLAADIDDLYKAYRFAAADSGGEVLAMKSLSEKINYTLSADKFRIMGITIPLYKIETGHPVLNSSLMGTGASYDSIREKSVPLLKLIVNYAALAKKVFLLSAELKKVQRRVNALEKIFIPSYEETKKYITDRLEEMDREEIFIKKLIGRSRGQ